MRKKILVFVFVLASINSIAQAKYGGPSHLEFKGVPIDGPLQEYVSKMVKTGFTHVQTEGGIAILKGDFAGFKNCLVGVVTFKQLDLVSKITVMFPQQATWSSLSSDYFVLKGLLTEKYGKPSNSVEKFEGSKPDDDNSKMHEVKMDRCKYYSTFETENGDIELSIEHESVISCYVQLSYFDKINGKKLKAKAIDDL